MNSEKAPTRVFVQARMSSSRFPGKVLAPLLGVPIILRVVEGIAPAVGGKQFVTVITSNEPSDDPLAVFLEHQSWSVFRGPLDNVFERFALACEAFPCERFVRICADSPLIGSVVPRLVLDHAAGSDADLVTNVFPKGFPDGQSVEVVDCETFCSIDRASLTNYQREHATQVFYQNADRFKIRNVPAPEGTDKDDRLVVDTLDDLRNLERRLLQGNLA